MKLKAAFLILCCFFSVLVFQSCTANVFSGSEDNRESSSGNGDGYGGKIVKRYDHFDSSNCPEISPVAKDLPRDQLLLLNDQSYLLTRQNCLDQALPTQIASALVQPTISGGVSYGGNEFQERPLNVGDFATVAAICPAGWSPLTNSLRQNLIQGSQAILSPSWNIPQGIATTFDGVLGGMLAYRVERNGAAPEFNDFPVRPAQFVGLETGQSYTFSFLAEPNANDNARGYFWDSGIMDIEVLFNLQNGTASVVRATGVVGGPAGVQFSTNSVSSSLFFSMTFTAVGNTNAHIGVTPSRNTFGTSIKYTAVQLEKTALFCSQN